MKIVIPKRLTLVKQPKDIAEWNARVQETAEWIAGNLGAMKIIGEKRLAQAKEKARRDALIGFARQIKWAVDDQGMMSKKELRKMINNQLGNKTDLELEAAMTNEEL